MTPSRPEQLNLQADPAFNIDLDLGFDLSSFDASLSTEPSSLLSPRTIPSSQSSFLDDEHFLEPAPAFELSSSHGIGGEFNLAFGDIELEAGEDRHGHTDQPNVDAENGDYVETARPDLNMEDNLLEMAEDGTIIMRDISEHGAISSDPIVANDGFLTEGMQDADFELMGGTEDADVIDIVSGMVLYGRRLTGEAKPSTLPT